MEDLVAVRAEFEDALAALQPELHAAQAAVAAKDEEQHRQCLASLRLVEIRVSGCLMPKEKT